MSLWSGKKPTDLRELYGFYHEFVKPLYSTVQSHNELPVEVLFEIHAALDHISRFYTYHEDEVVVVNKAYGHLKRCCLDIFKIKTREAIDQYNEIKKIDTSCIDNGGFERRLHALAADIREKASEARKIEGEPDGGDTVPAFDAWCPVYELCVEMENDFFLNKHLNWARRRGFTNIIKDHFASFLVGCFASSVVIFLTTAKQNYKNMSLLLKFDLIAIIVLIVVFAWGKYYSKPVTD